MSNRDYYFISEEIGKLKQHGAEKVADNKYQIKENGLDMTIEKVNGQFVVTITDERKYFKRSRTLLLKHMSELDPSGKEAVIRMVRSRKDLADAYLLKEKFYAFMDSKNSEEARSRLHEFGLFAAALDIPEFQPLMSVLRNWSKYILNSFDCGYTNGFTEGCNNKIKVLKRIAFGYRSFQNLRQRILLTNDPARYAANPTPRGA